MLMDKCSGWLTTSTSRVDLPAVTAASDVRTRDLLRKVGVSLSRPDFVRNPLRASWRRLYWRVRWKLRTHQLWELRLACNRLRILVPHSGAGALLYYQGFTEPDATDFLLRFLKPGMIFIDVGAHIGEYVLLAAKKVGPEGEVHGFEPHKLIFSILEENVRINNLPACFLNPIAVFEHEGELDFEIRAEPSLSAIRVQRPRPESAPLTKVPAIRLDDYCAQRRRNVNLIKIDTEGAELFVLRGARKLLSQNPPQAPVLIFEYDKNNMRSFGYEGSTLLNFLREQGYGVWYYRPSGKLPSFTVVTPEFLRSMATTVNLVAAKCFDQLPLRNQ